MGKGRKPKTDPYTREKREVTPTQKGESIIYPKRGKKGNGVYNTILRNIVRGKRRQKGRSGESSFT